MFNKESHSDARTTSSVPRAHYKPPTLDSGLAVRKTKPKHNNRKP